KFSCKTASETLRWISAILQFLESYRFFLDAHLVNFFKDRLWEKVDVEWMDCLRNESVESLLRIPSGVVQDHWPASLKQYVLTLDSLSLPRDQTDLQEAFQGLKIEPLNTVVSQGMNRKKKHEIETLSAVVSSVAGRVGAKTIVDVGSGQGYLAQVLAFEHGLSVVAIDASPHHGSVTAARSLRIEKHYAARKNKLGLTNKSFVSPKTVTCRVQSPSMLKDVLNCTIPTGSVGNSVMVPRDEAEPLLHDSASALRTNAGSSFLLAGLHACGDLSVTMLRTFVECEDVKALVSIGCCYNLLSEEDDDGHRGFPVSRGAKPLCSVLGKNARDLACQSAERWKCLEEGDGFHNFELHAFRAAFQMLLFRYYPETLDGRSLPSVGRQGKTLRRRQHQRGSSHLASKESSEEPSFLAKRYSGFVEFSKSGLRKLGLPESSSHIEYSRIIWHEAEIYFELIGPYWTLRAALGPVLETALMLDRVLYLQEQQEGSLLIEEVELVSVFHPFLSPRNLALIASK
ncbi:hypothetical protein M569_01800, partial [Genlisea aurea]